jgi:phospholipase D-like protein
MSTNGQTPDTGAKQSAKRKLRDLSTRQRIALGAVALVQNSLLVAALVDLRKRPSRKVRGDKRVWAALSFVSWVGPISYFAYGRKR